MNIPSGIETKPVRPGGAAVYLKKSQEFMEDAKSIFEHQHYNSATLLAVHAVISACDAVTAFLFNLRHKGDRHEDVVKLIQTVDLKRAELSKKVQQITQVLGVKNTAEYEDKLITEKDAHTAVLIAERIVSWVETQIPPR